MDFCDWSDLNGEEGADFESTPEAVNVRDKRILSVSYGDGDEMQLMLLRLLGG